MIDDRGLCVCGHDVSEHGHYVAECGACDDCAAYKDQNDLDKELNDAST